MVFDMLEINLTRVKVLRIKITHPFTGIFVIFAVGMFEYVQLVFVAGNTTAVFGWACPFTGYTTGVRYI